MKNTEAIYFYFHLYVYPVHNVTAVMFKNLAFLFPWSPFFGLSFEHLIFKLAYNLLVCQTYFWFDEQKLLCCTWGNADAIK